MRNLAPALAAAVILAAVGSDASARDTWAGAGGAPVPLEDGTPVVVELVSVSFTAVPPALRRLDDPRFAEHWEISIRVDLRNPSDRDVRLTLAVPEVPTSPGAAGPHVREVAISQDGLRMPVAPSRVENLPDIGVPAEAFRAVAVEFAPGQGRRIDVLLRQPAPAVEGGAVLARWLGAGLGRFAGSSIPVQRFAWRFGDRVRLVRGNGPSPFDTPGASARFVDDGWRSRLEFEIRDAPPLSAFDLEARAAGPGAAPERLALSGQLRLAAGMNRTELAVARALLLAIHGRALGRVPEARLFEELPWGPCNPAFRLARGEALPDRPVEELIAEARCTADCRTLRQAPADPFGDPWADPLCWHSPDTHRERTTVRDPGLHALLQDIKTRLAAERTSAPVEPAPGACGCGAPGRRPRRGTLPALLGLAPR